MVEDVDTQSRECQHAVQLGISTPQYSVRCKSHDQHGGSLETGNPSRPSLACKVTGTFWGSVPPLEQWTRLIISTLARLKILEESMIEQARCRWELKSSGSSPILVDHQQRNTNNYRTFDHLSRLRRNVDRDVVHCMQRQAKQDTCTHAARKCKASSRSIDRRPTRTCMM